MVSAADKLAIAQSHLRRVQDAWDDPTDWDDLCLYGFYALEAAVDCARLHFEEPTRRTHSSRVDAARELRQYGLEDVSALLRDLNEGRKSVAYGDADLPDISPHELAAKLEEFIDSVADLLKRGEVR